MAAKEFYHDIDLVKVSQLLNFRVHNITTTDRGTLGGTLSGSHTGLTVYDTDLDALYVWDGSAWDAIGSISGAMTFKGVVAYNAAEPGSPATGDFYVFNTAGTNTWESSDVVQIGDSVVWDGTNWKFIQGNVVAATTSVAGNVELATDAESSTATDTTRAVTPSGLNQFASDRKLAKVYFISGASLVANTPLTVTHNLALQNKNAFTINVMSSDSQVSVDVDSTDTNSLTVTSAVSITASITVIGY